MRYKLESKPPAQTTSGNTSRALRNREWLYYSSKVVRTIKDMYYWFWATPILLEVLG